MKNKTQKHVVIGATLTLLVTGCASMAVTNDAIVQKTSFALGTSIDQFTISNRVDDGLQTRYTATTKTGKVYMCYVEGTVTLAGRVVSDALCNEMNKSDTPVCNDLLKAAGNC